MDNKRPGSRSSAPRSSRKGRTPQAEPRPGTEDRSAIARRAYERFMARGGAHGHDLEDWLEAERELHRKLGRSRPEQGMSDGA